MSFIIIKLGIFSGVLDEIRYEIGRDRVRDSGGFSR